jgi:hypothetical protein
LVENGGRGVRFTVCSSPSIPWWKSRTATKPAIKAKMKRVVEAFLGIAVGVRLPLILIFSSQER